VNIPLHTSSNVCVLVVPWITCFCMVCKASIKILMPSLLISLCPNSIGSICSCSLVPVLGLVSSLYYPTEVQVHTCTCRLSCCVRGMHVQLKLCLVSTCINNIVRNRGGSSEGRTGLVTRAIFVLHTLPQSCINLWPSMLILFARDAITRGCVSGAE